MILQAIESYRARKLLLLIRNMISFFQLVYLVSTNTFDKSHVCNTVDVAHNTYIMPSQNRKNKCLLYDLLLKSAGSKWTLQ